MGRFGPGFTAGWVAHTGIKPKNIVSRRAVRRLSRRERGLGRGPKAAQRLICIPKEGSQFVVRAKMALFALGRVGRERRRHGFWCAQAGRERDRRGGALSLVFHRGAVVEGGAPQKRHSTEAIRGFHGDQRSFFYKSRNIPRICSEGHVPKYTGGVISVNTLPSLTGVFGTAAIPYRTVR